MTELSPSDRRRILHVDMDAFYASVEAHDDPTLAGRPLVVGGTGARGVVASCSYEARAFGIRSAMPAARARRLCPQAIFLAGRYDRYAEVSARVHTIFEDYTPLVEGIALDEAFLDVTGSVRLFGSAVTMASAIRERVATELGLACSVGVARSKFLAKLASQAAKPLPGRGRSRPGPGQGRQIVEVVAGEELRFLHPMAVEALWGVGPATAARLSRLGLATIGDLAAVPLDALESGVGRAHGRALHDLAHARDDRPVVADRPAKSIGHEETYAHDRFGLSELAVEVVRMADGVAARLRHHGLVGRTITVKIRYGNFTTITRSRTIPAPTDVPHAIAGVASTVLGGVDLSGGVRLLGVTVSNLVPAVAEVEQMRLRLHSSDPGDAPAAGWSAANAALTEVRRRYGEASVGPASLLGDDGLRLKRPGDTQWGPADDPPPAE